MSRRRIIAVGLISICLIGASDAMASSEAEMDVWQTSQGAFLKGKGDCEDHAVILADPLIDIGLDARVVLGDYRGRGHAWKITSIYHSHYRR